jgi:nucleotide-binding universal stress UspA family protein
MNSQERQFGIQRILVVVDTSRQSLLALQIAASLASRLDAEVIGIFVEDINLFRLTELPFIQEVSYYSARPYPLSSQSLERQMRASSRRLREIIQMFSASSNLRWSLETARGSYPRDLLASVLDTDLLILVQSGLPGMRRVGPVVRSLIQQAPRQALIVNLPVEPGKQVTILYDGSESSKKALLAGELVIAAENPVVVLIIAKDFEQALRLQAQAQAELAPFPQQVRYHWLRSADVILLTKFSRREKCGVLVIPAESDSLPIDKMLSLLDRTECSVLLVH